MSQDIVSDIMNQIMNRKRARHRVLVIKNRNSKLLVQILDMMKETGHLDYELKDNVLKIEFKSISECKSIKPRYNVKVKGLDKYIRRYLPARDFGFIIVSTSKGLMTHYEAKEQNLGGCLIAYYF